MERHRRAVDFANAADGARPHSVIHHRPHVHDRRSIGRQWYMQRRRDDHRHHTLLPQAHIRQHLRFDGNVPTGQQPVDVQPDVRRYRVGVHKLVREVPHRELAEMRHARFQRFRHVQVALAELRHIGNRAENIHPHLNTEVSRCRRNPHRADDFVSTGGDRHLDRWADRLKRQADTEGGAAEFHRDCLCYVAGVLKFDADFRRFARARRVGPDVDLRLGEEGVLRAVKRHRRPVEFAKTAD